MGSSEAAPVPIGKHPANNGQAETTRNHAGRGSSEQREYSGQRSCAESNPAKGGTKTLCHTPDCDARCADSRRRAVSQYQCGEASREAD